MEMTKKDWFELAEKRFINHEDDFVEALAYTFDDNYYNGCKDLVIGGLLIAIESLWTDDDGNVMVHVNCLEFEGDLKLASLTRDNQASVLWLIKEDLKDL